MKMLLAVFIAWVMAHFFNFDTMFVRAIHELGNFQVTIAQYYFFFFLLGFIAEVIDHLTKIKWLRYR